MSLTRAERGKKREREREREMGSEIKIERESVCVRESKRERE